MKDTGAYEHLRYSIAEPVVCTHCADEVKSGEAGITSLSDYGALDVGFSDRGLQVWCRRHGTNVVHIDFDGRKPPMDFRALLRRRA
ncbi:MAG: hypothetical protein AAF436_19515 [Myxococcota bacterium]